MEKSLYRYYNYMTCLILQMTTQTMNLNFSLWMILGLVIQPFERSRHQSKVSEIFEVIMANIERLTKMIHQTMKYWCSFHIEIIIPPNVTVKRVMRDNITMLQVRWDPPLHPVRRYDILYRKFEWVYTGRWQLKEINDPTALSSEIIVHKPEKSFLVIVRGRPV